MDEGLNWDLDRAINGLAGHVSLLDKLAVFAANDLVFLIVLGAVVWWFLPLPGDVGKRGAIAAALALVGGLAVSVVIAHLDYVPRPFVAHHVDLLVHHAADSSFPSDHATAAFAVASTAALRWLPGRWLMLIAAVLVAVARIYVGVHYPADVIAGAIIGTVFATVVLRLDPLLAPPTDLAIGIARRLHLG